MSLSETINNDIKAAMLSKDAGKLRGLRAIKAAILLAQTEKGASRDLSPEKELQILQKLVKQRKESFEIFKKQNREDLAAKEEEEIATIEQYLPEQMSENEVSEHIVQIIKETGATSIKDMGKVMAVAAKKLAGKADSKQIADLVKKALA